MPLRIIRQDITKIECDAIVNSTNSAFKATGGLDAAIHKAAGPELDRECAMLGTLNAGEAVATEGYKLPCKYIIHSVAPIWSTDKDEIAARCYRKSLALAANLKCESVAVPLIGTGTLGIPHKTAMKIAIDAIGDFLMDNEMLVYLVVYGKDEFKISSVLFSDVKSYIDDNYVESHPMLANSARLELHKDYSCTELAAPQFAAKISLKLELDESFTEMLLRKIDEKGMTDAECYKKANIDRKLFSKIRSDKLYKPSKNTAIAFAIALELDLRETEEMLRKAGFALSHSNKFDLIVEYFIKSRNYNIFEINETLFEFDQSLLGG